MSFVVAIDGPAGTGKGTIASLISKEMGLINIDTGATYRCVALFVLNNNIDINNNDQIIKSLDKINIDLKNENGIQKVYLNNEDVSSKIRTEQVSYVSSKISCIKEVRQKLVKIQRDLAKNKDVIMEGRDITTVVFPNADVKIYMDANIEERAKRRFLENKEKGLDVTFEEVLENIKKRDKNDMEKEIGALKIAEDAIYLDTTDLTIEQVKNKVKEIIKYKKG